MIEDIWSNFENYKLQSQVMLKRTTLEKNSTAKKFQEEELEEPFQKVVELRR